MTEDKPYSLATLILNLLALSIEGVLMVAGITWLMLQKHDMLMAYVFSTLIALFSVGLGILQIHYYRKDKRRGESESDLNY